MAEANYGIFGDDFSLEGTNPASGLNSISDSSVSFGGGGGGGVVVSTPNNVVIPITTNPNAYGTINANTNLIVNIKANQEAQIYVNAENTFKTTTNKLDVSLNDLLKFGSKTITVDKTGFKSNEKYIFRAVPNLNFNFSNLNFKLVIIIRRKFLKILGFINPLDVPENPIIVGLIIKNWKVKLSLIPSR